MASESRKEQMRLYAKKAYAKRKERERLSNELTEDNMREYSIQQSEKKKLYAKKAYAKRKERERLSNELTEDNMREYSIQQSEKKKKRGSSLFLIALSVAYTTESNEFIYEPSCSDVHVLKDRRTCCYCNALKFEFEFPTFCCDNGKIKLAHTSAPPELVALFTEKSYFATEFRKNIRSLNSLFAFTSFGVTNYDMDLASGRKGVYTFRVQGQVYHELPSLKLSSNGPCYFQLYYYETEREVENRLQVMKNPNVRPEMIRHLMKIMEINPYAVFFRRLENISSIDDVHLHISANAKLDQRVYNAPTVDQVAALWIEGNNPYTPIEREIIVNSHSGFNHRIKPYYGCYDALQYPILFPFGELGWHNNLRKVDPNDERAIKRTSLLSSLPSYLNRVDKRGSTLLSSKIAERLISNMLAEEENGSNVDDGRNVSCREYYCYKFQIRSGCVNLLHLAGRLFQQFSVDQYIKLETTRLQFIRNNQKELRAELYQGIVDSVSVGETRGNEIGTRIILPASFIGGPRDMGRKYFDSMSLVQRFGKPDLFITMTCNSEWPEIRQAVIGDQPSQDRPDVVSRVFRAKLEDLKDQLFKKEIFGSVAAHVHVVEFQKRGLPHAHLLVILQSEYKIHTPNHFDKVVCAEIPDVNEFPELHELVLANMMHGPCGEKNPLNPCMVDGTCKMRFPRDFSTETIQGNDGYPLYRRRDTNTTVRVRKVDLDNRWVVPYNPYLLSRYNCHINVEVCSGVQAVKYLYKYIYKGHDRVAVHIDHNGTSDIVDEIKSFQDARWVAAQESMWRIFAFKLHDIYPSVIRLQLHLPNMQSVTYCADQSLKKVLDSDRVSRTMLTEYFFMCSENEKARGYFYYQFPEYYVWDTTARRWHERKKGVVIGRVNGAHPGEGERYYLRLLLNHVKGPTSFEDLLQVDEFDCATFKESALRRGLLESDKSIIECLNESVVYSMPFTLRRLFATILAWCEPTNVRNLWESYSDALSEDYTRGLDGKFDERLTELGKIKTLIHLKSLLKSMGKKIKNFDLPRIPLNSITKSDVLGSEIEEELSNCDPLVHCPTSLKVSLNADQRKAYQSIIERVESGRPGVFFVDGPGGTGKTYLYNSLLAHVRSTGSIALATATSGVAAHILPGGRTAHSRFKIPIDANEGTYCSFRKQSETGDLMRAAKLFIWDEAPMANRFAIETLERTLRDMVDLPLEPFGGKVVVFGGDFRQVLPVVPKGTIQQTIEASLIKSTFWPIMEKFTLTINMRAITDSTFSDFLLRVGDGVEPTNSEGNIQLPKEMVVKFDNEEASENRLIDLIYPNLATNCRSSKYMTTRAILAPKNQHVDRLNETLISRFPGKEKVYASFDDAVDDVHQYYTEEYLNTLTPNGLPPHRIVLKKNCPIMLLRNLDPANGMCNGTRMVCRHFEDNVIHAEITEGTFAGKEVFIPRIPLYPKQCEGYPFKLRRKQFPIRLCFAMTINKAQGQTIPDVGIYLPQSVFSHGQLYVALSRGTSMSRTKVLVMPELSNTNNSSSTKNVVYQEVLKLGVQNFRSRRS